MDSRTIKVAVQRGKPMLDKKGNAKLDSKGRPRIALDRVFFVDGDGEKLDDHDVAQQLRAWKATAEIAANVWNDAATVAVATAYAEHAAGAITQADEAVNADGSKRYNVMRAKAERTVPTLEAAFDYVADVRKTA